jgi:hypothetical protein
VLIAFIVYLFTNQPTTNMSWWYDKHARQRWGFLNSSIRTKCQSTTTQVQASAPGSGQGGTSETSCCQRVCRRCHPGLHTSKKQTKQTAEENKGKQIILFHNYTGGASIATTQHGTQLVNERKTIGLSAKCIPQMKNFWISQCPLQSFVSQEMLVLDNIPTWLKFQRWMSQTRWWRY